MVRSTRRGHRRGSLGILIPVFFLGQSEVIFAKMCLVCSGATASCSAVGAKSPAGVGGGTWEPHFVPFCTFFVPKHSA